jgi:hypothetical protein
MPRIYLTYRPEDSTRHEVERIYERMVARYGADNILRTAAGSNADPVYLAALISDCDALIVVMGRFWRDMLTEDGRRVIDDPDDYQHIELMTALAREDMWVTVVFTDGAHVPTAEELPPDLQSLLQHDRLEAPTLDALDKGLDLLETRIGFAGTADIEHEAPVVKDEKINKEAGAAANQGAILPGSKPEAGCLVTMAGLLILLLVAITVTTSKPPYIHPTLQPDELSATVRSREAVSYPVGFQETALAQRQMAMTEAAIARQAQEDVLATQTAAHK